MYNRPGTWSRRKLVAILRVSELTEARELAAEMHHGITPSFVWKHESVDFAPRVDFVILGTATVHSCSNVTVQKFEPETFRSLKTKSLISLADVEDGFLSKAVDRLQTWFDRLEHCPPEHTNASRVELQKNVGFMPKHLSVRSSATNYEELFSKNVGTCHVNAEF
jgi:hypothetical protein